MLWNYFGINDSLLQQLSSSSSSQASKTGVMDDTDGKRFFFFYCERSLNPVASGSTLYVGETLPLRYYVPLELPFYLDRFHPSHEASNHTFSITAFVLFMMRWYCYSTDHRNDFYYEEFFCVGYIIRVSGSRPIDKA